ncbi:MAG: hypothetical protein K2M43_00255, partial [Mycoplasmoidaceae bacterium]|nr:hypothetical protein [Mycoplasmoidaceae bacterium]
TLISQEFDILSKGIVSGGDGAKAFIEEVKVISNLLKDTGDFSKIKEELKNFITLQDKLHDVNDKKYGFALSYESGSAQVPFT